MHPHLSILETESSYGHFGDDSFILFLLTKFCFKKLHHWFFIFELRLSIKTEIQLNIFRHPI